MSAFTSFVELMKIRDVPQIIKPKPMNTKKIESYKKEDRKDTTPKTSKKNMANILSKVFHHLALNLLGDI